MNIIAGQRKGTQLFAPKGLDTRPTQAKVKESLFNIIQAYVPDARVLDLFAGSGSLALEALSRGASYAVLVDRDREAGQCIRRNIEKLRFEGVATFIASDWKQVVAQMKTSQVSPFDLVFLDPPYRMTELCDMCAALGDAGLLSQDAMLVLEHRTGTHQPPDDRFVLFRERTYADTEIHFYLYHAAEEGEP